MMKAPEFAKYIRKRTRAWKPKDWEEFLDLAELVAD